MGAQNFYSHGSEIPETFLSAIAKKLTDNPVEFGKNSIVPIEPLAVITHGDYLRNNIAFKYENDVSLFNFFLN